MEPRSLRLDNAAMIVRCQGRTRGWIEEERARERGLKLGFRTSFRVESGRRGEGFSAGDSCPVLYGDFRVLATWTVDPSVRIWDWSAVSWVLRVWARWRAKEKRLTEDQAWPLDRHTLCPTYHILFLNIFFFKKKLNKK